MIIIYYKTPLGDFFERVNWTSDVADVEELIAKMSSGETPFRKFSHAGRVHFLGKQVLMASIISYDR